MSSLYPSFTKEQAKEEVGKLVEKYKLYEENGDAKKLNEAGTRKDFVMPLFRALNWDIENSKEVSAEESISNIRVDFGFRIDGIPKFFLETKALKEDLIREHAEQAVNYSWLKSVTWAVLTNFNQLRIYNSEWKSDRVSDKLFFPLFWNEYIDKFDKLWLLSKDSFQQNAIDKMAEEWGKKEKKTPVSPVMKQLFEDLMKWRQDLTKDIVRHRENKEIIKSEEILDESIQRILDRLIFIRVCEDRGIEPRTLLSELREWKGNTKGKPFIKVLGEIYRDFDNYYNSKLFSPHVCEELIIDDSVFNDIINELYESADKTLMYNFSVIDADVLGNIYEEYLGYVLKKGKGKIAENHAHRKEMGIYYTPTYVVDYIIQNTLGKILEEQGDNKVRVLDPACGSGSFLIKAYEKLVQHHKESEFEEKVKILSKSIFGVDIDPKAVEITQLNLLLRAVEKRKLLPMMQNNIKVGNSLINDEKVAGNRAFKWSENFAEIIQYDENGSTKKGCGFDVIIGNPPYVRPHNLDIKDKEFFWEHFKTFRAKSDLYNCFMEQGIKLIKEKGLFSFIVPHTWTSLESFFEIRKYILESCRVVKLIQLPKKVFQDATVETCIFVLSKESDSEIREANKIIVEKLDEKGQVSFVKEYKQSQIKKNHLFNFELYSEDSGNKLLNNIKQRGAKLGTIVDFLYGLKTGDDEKFIFDRIKNDDCKKLLRSKDIRRYTKQFKGKYVWYAPELMIKNKKTARPGDKKRFETQKIIVARMGKKVVATFDDDNYYVKDAMLLLRKSDDVNLRYIVSILNSKLINYFYKNYFITIDVLKNALLELPIAPSNEGVKTKLSGYVEKIEKLNKRLADIGDKKTDERERLEKEINDIDIQIDKEVNALYGLTDEEIRIVEGT